MITVHIDMSRATTAEVESFYALPSVGSALDQLAIFGRPQGVFLTYNDPLPVEPFYQTLRAEASQC